MPEMWKRNPLYLKRKMAHGNDWFLWGGKSEEDERKSTKKMILGIFENKA